MDADARPGTWPELLYRFIEHYKWEPHHLKASDYAARMRRQEVPLNFMLNLLLRCSTPDTIKKLLQCFEPETPLPDDDLELLFPWETKSTQPDVRLEGSLSRVFIEVKVEAKIELGQVRKYVKLHQDMDENFGAKKHYLFFLTKRPFAKCWKPQAATLNFLDVHSFVEEQLGGKASSVKCSAATWTQFTGQLRVVLATLDERRTVERRIINDFLHDLGSRSLTSGKS